jgi:site-specific DNA recombinase
MQKKAALYARVSTDEQVNNYSIGAQVDSIRQVAAIRNYSIVGEYIDEGRSGTLLSRPALDRLLHDCKTGKVNTIIVYKIDRFFRDIRHLLNTMEELEQLRVEFISATEPFDTSTSIGKYILGQFGLAAELERTTFMERSRIGRTKRIQEGKWWGNIPYGYDYDSQTGKLIKNEESAIVKEMFEIYLLPGSSLTTVAEEMNNRGYRNRSGKKWTENALHDILTNQVYSGKKLITTNSKAGTAVEIEVSPIVDQGVFEATKKTLAARKNISRKTTGTTFILKPLIFCECGSSMCANQSNYLEKINQYRYSYYACHSSRKGRCNLPWVKKDVIEEAVWSEIKAILLNPEDIKLALEQFANNNNDKEQESHEDILNKINKISEEKKALFRSYRKNLISEEEMEQLLEELSSEEKYLQEKLKKYTVPDVGELIQEQVMKFSIFKSQYDNVLENLSETEKRDIVSSLVEKVLVNELGEVTIMFHAETPLAIKTKLCQTDKYPRKKKKGRKPNISTRSISLTRETWDNIIKLAGKHYCFPTILIIRMVKEWLNSGESLPRVERRKTALNQHTGGLYPKRTSVNFGREVLGILDREATEANTTFSAAIRYIIDRQITHMQSR